MSSCGVCGEPDAVDIRHGVTIDGFVVKVSVPVCVGMSPMKVTAGRSNVVLHTRAELQAKGVLYSPKLPPRPKPKAKVPKL